MKKNNADRLLVIAKELDHMGLFTEADRLENIIKNAKGYTDYETNQSSQMDRNPYMDYDDAANQYNEPHGTVEEFRAQKEKASKQVPNVSNLNKQNNTTQWTNKIQSLLNKFLSGTGHPEIPQTGIADKQTREAMSLVGVPYGSYPASIGWSGLYKLIEQKINSQTSQRIDPGYVPGQPIAGRYSK